MEQEKHIFGLDLIRVMAIGTILLAQCLWVLPNLNPLVSQVLSVFHFVALEVFLVLSGYLMFAKLYPLYLQNKFNSKTVLLFMRKRLLRILPLYYLILLLNMVLATALGIPIRHVWKYFFFIQNLASPMPPFFQESWGLPIVIFGTILFPMVLWLFSRLKNPKNKPLFFLILTLILIVLELFVKLWYNKTTFSADMNHWDIYLKSVTIYRLDSIFIGVAAGWLVSNRSIAFKRIKGMLAVIGFLGMAFLLFGVGYFQLLIETQPLFWNVLYLPMTSVIIALFLPFLVDLKPTDSLMIRTIGFLSSIAYPLYFLGVGTALRLMSDWLYESKTGLAATVLALMAYLILVTLLATLIHRSYEKNIVRLARKISNC